MVFWPILILAPLSKALVSGSVFLLKYFDVPLLLAYFALSLIGAVVMGLWCMYQNVPWLRGRLLFLNTVRFVLRDSALFLIFYAFLHGSVPRVSAIYFSTSFFIPIFGRLLLKIKTAPHQWFFLALGYVGIIIILNPFGQLRDPIIDALVLISAMSISMSNVLVKYLANRGVGVANSLLASSVFRCVVSVIFLLIFFQDIQQSTQGFSGNLPTLWGVLLAGAFLQNLSQGIHLYTYRWGRLSFLAGLDLMRFVFDALMGYFVFEHVMTTRESVGVSVIVVAILSLSYTNWKLLKSRRGLK